MSLTPLSQTSMRSINEVFFLHMQLSPDVYKYDETSRYPVPLIAGLSTENIFYKHLQLLRSFIDEDFLLRKSS